MEQHDQPSGSRPPEFQPTKQEQWTQFLHEYPQQLSESMLKHIRRYEREQQIPENVVELACGLHPLTSALDVHAHRRILVDIIDLNQELPPQEDTPTLIQSNLDTPFILTHPDHPFQKALDSMGGNFGALFIGSGINYFPWQATLDTLLPRLEPDGLVFIHSAITQIKPSGAGLGPLVDHEHKPQSIGHIRAFFTKRHYAILDDYRDSTFDSMIVDMVAQKPSI